MTAPPAEPLIGADAFARLLASGEEVVLLDARPSAADYEAGHLPGAIHASLDRQLSAVDDPSRGGRHPLPPIDRWLAQVAEWGIGPETRVVVYDDQQGANAAARAWWMLRAIGHENVAVLDGDWRSVKVNGVAAGASPAPSRPRRAERPPPHEATHWQLPTADAAAVDRVRSDPSWRVLDVRAAPRFLGVTEPIDPIAGHIPGAVNLPYVENVDGPRFRSPDALRTRYEQFLGDVPPEHLIVHCGSGVTACQTLLALEAAGLTGASLYVGSWSEWCRNPWPREP